MVEKIIKYKNYIISIMSLIMLLTLFFGINHLMKSKNKEPLPEVKLREINKSKAFAVMVQTDNGYEEYRSKDNTWPGNGYVFKEAKCTDNKGNLVTDAITFADGKATLTTNQTIYCTLYFDKISLGEQIKKNKPNGLNLNLEGGMYRYQGQKTENIENYICLENNCESGSNDMYRIVGIDEGGNVKIIKETSLGTISYNNDRDINTKWIESNIYKALNTNDDSFYNKLSETQKKMILEKDWYYGDLYWNKFLEMSKNLDDLYKIENGLSDAQWEENVPLSEKGKENVICRIISKQDSTHYNEEMCYIIRNGKWQSVKANIGLLYMYDYYYAVQNGGLNCATLQTGNQTLCNENWLKIDKIDLLITKRGYQEDYGFYGNYVIGLDGLCSSTTITSKHDYRPVFYLKNSLIITSGNGNINTPFVVNVR